MTRARRKTAMQEVQEKLARRREAMRNGFAGLVVVRCKECGRPIRTTAVDQAKGEPPILFEFPEDVGDWQCTDCWTAERARG